MRSCFLLASVAALVLSANAKTTFNDSSFKEAQAQWQTIENLKNTFEILDSVEPNLNAKAWLDHAKQNQINLKSLKNSALRFEGQKIYFDGVENPFTYQNDGTFLYKGIGFKPNPQESPNENFKRIVTAWGAFKEFGTEKNSKASLFLFESTAFANDNEKMSNPAYRTHLRVINLYFSGLSLFLGAPGAVFGAINLLLPELLILHQKTVALRDIQLDCSVCTNETCALSETLKAVETKNSAQKKDDILSTFTPEEQTKAGAALKQVCSAGPDSVKKFNSIAALVRTKIADGRIDGIVAESSVPHTKPAAPGAK